MYNCGKTAENARDSRVRRHGGTPCLNVYATSLSDSARAVLPTIAVAEMLTQLRLLIAATLTVIVPRHHDSLHHAADEHAFVMNST